MNATVCTSVHPHRRVMVKPGGRGTIDLQVKTKEGALIASVTLTPDEVGALLFGIECAAEAAGISKDREQAR